MKTQIARLLLIPLALALLGAAWMLTATGTLAAPSVAPTVVAIWGGARHCIVLLSDGTVWDWGMNWYGKLGDNTLSVFGGPNFSLGSHDHFTPIQVHGPGNVGYLTGIINRRDSASPAPRYQADPHAVRSDRGTQHHGGS